MTGSPHKPVLTAALLELLQLRAGASCIDATIDGGGHTRAVLERTAPNGRVLGIDRDPELLTNVRVSLASFVAAGRLQLACGNFRMLSAIATAHHFTAVQAIIFDLGLSSFHLDVSGRGFSFMRDEALDMRFDQSEESPETAEAMLASRSAAQLTTIFGDYGEERYARRIAATIVACRRQAPIRTTNELYELIRVSLPSGVRWQAARSAARVFQALRIAVNDELAAIAAVLPQALSVLAPGGHLAVLAFHSLEDRIVKQFLVAERQAGRVRILTKKPLRASEGEIADNSRAASAKLRVAERL